MLHKGILNFQGTHCTSRFNSTRNIRCYSLSLVVNRCLSMCYSLSLIVIFFTTRCHTSFFSLGVPLFLIRYHLLSLDVSLVCGVINDMFFRWLLSLRDILRYYLEVIFSQLTKVTYIRLMIRNTNYVRNS